jgi:hypothetical protein
MGKKKALTHKKNGRNAHQKPGFNDEKCGFDL